MADEDYGYLEQGVPAGFYEDQQPLAPLGEGGRRPGQFRELDAVLADQGPCVSATNVYQSSYFLTISRTEVAKSAVLDALKKGGVREAVVVTERHKGAAKEAKNARFGLSQGKFHAVVSKGAANVSGASRNPSVK